MRKNWLLAAFFVAPTVWAAEQLPPGLPEIQRPFEDLKPERVWQLGKNADWVEFSPGAVWVGASGPNKVHRIDLATGEDSPSLTLPGNPCAGLVAGFRSLWVPVCDKKRGNRTLRVSLKGRRLIWVMPYGAPAEGGIAASKDSIWFPIDRAGTLVRIEPKDGRLRRKVMLPPGSTNLVYEDGRLWVTCNDSDLLSIVEADTGVRQGHIRVGPNPRFLTVGAGSIWVLNQGDGSVTRVDVQSQQVIATIPLGLPGPGGDIAFGDGKVWVTVAGVPLTAIDPETNKPIAQWVGLGGDSLKVADGFVWLTDYRAGTIAKIKDPLLE